MYSGNKQILWAVLFLFLLTSCSQAQVLTPLSTTPLTTKSTSIPLTPSPSEEAAQTPAIQVASTATPKELDPTSAPAEVEEIHFQSAQFALVGDLQIPNSEGKHPVVIMVHGDGGIDRTGHGTYIPLMERFLRAGYAVFSWDKPGSGESSGEFSHGAELLSERASIMVDAVNLLKEHPAIDPGRIGVWGISQAGYVMPLALTRTDDISFMIVTGGPGMNSFDQMVYLIGQQFLCTGYSAQESNKIEANFAKLFYADTYLEYRESKEYLIRFPYALNFTGIEITPQEEWSPEDYSHWVYFNPIEVIEGTTIPVLSIFGEKDTQVDPFQGTAAYQAALEAAGNQNFRVELFPDADHNIVLARTGCMEERNNRSMADWLNYAPGYLDLVEEWLINVNK
jgi:fermentation-respiration switch protein FrsA (DUF1100 family)